MSETIELQDTNLERFAAFVHLGHTIYLIWRLIDKGDAIKAKITRFGGLDHLEPSEYNIANLLPLFPLLSTINHLVTVFKKQHIPWLQWGEYSISAGLMLWFVANLSGVLDLATLVSIIIQNIFLQYIGYRMTQARNTQEYNQLLMIGFGLHVSIWVPIVSNFYASLSIANRKEGVEIPGIVYYIVWVMFGLFTTFGVYPIFSDIRKCTKSSRRSYTILSLITKSILIYLVFFGIIREDDTVTE